MSTTIKDQALDVSVIGEQGFGGIRYYEDKLQVFQDGEWITVIGEKTIPVESITLVYTSTNCENGGDFDSSPHNDGACTSNPPHYITATVLPDNATDKSLTWSSSNTEAATIDPFGIITFVNAKGKTVIYTATANDGSGVSASFQVWYSSATCAPCKQ